jgi:hypothetical protein
MTTGRDVQMALYSPGRSFLNSFLILRQTLESVTTAAFLFPALRGATHPRVLFGRFAVNDYAGFPMPG